jgi:ornithine--oxo-acid transaminase
MKRSAQEIIRITEKFAVMNYERYPVVFVDGFDSTLIDSRGKIYVDMAAGYGVYNIGRNNERWRKAVYGKRLASASGNYYYEHHAELLVMLNELCGKDRALFSCEGAVSVDAAMKFACKWGYVEKGVEENKAEILSTDKNFHGRTKGAVGMSPVEKYKHGFGPFPPGLDTRVVFGDADDLARKITKNTVAFFVEIVAGEGGVHIPPPGYFKKVQEICRENNVLLIDDEIQAGLGRTGYDLAYRAEGIDPDMIILGKALGGEVPLSVVLGNENVMGRKIIHYGEHGSTYGAYSLGCKAGIASLEILRDEKLSQRATVMGSQLMQGLKTIRSKYIKEIRGRGLFIGVELDGFDSHKFCELMLKEGVACLTARDNVVRFSPPLIITEQEIGKVLDRVAKVFRGLEKK